MARKFGKLSEVYNSREWWSSKKRADGAEFSPDSNSYCMRGKPCPQEEKKTKKKTRKEMWRRLDMVYGTWKRGKRGKKAVPDQLMVIGGSDGTPRVVQLCTCPRCGRQHRSAVDVGIEEIVQDSATSNVKVD